jgi:hypothetical protein
VDVSPTVELSSKGVINSSTGILRRPNNGNAKRGRIVSQAEINAGGGEGGGTSMSGDLAREGDTSVGTWESTDEGMGESGAGRFFLGFVSTRARETNSAVFGTFSVVGIGCGWGCATVSGCGDIGGAA